MIAIPNMDKPKKCKECPYKACIRGMHFIEALNYMSGIKEQDEPPDDCPIIEIPDEIWEALKPKVETMSLAEKGWITDDSNT